ncbi:MAG: PD-(D/E)XK nuclease family protein [Chloroflexota bacterium]
MIVGFQCQHRHEVTFEECFACALTQRQPCQFSYPILVGMMRTEHEEVEGIRVTSLLNCLRKVVLEKRLDVHVPPEQLYWSFRGRLAHAIVEYAQADGAIVEKRFTRQVEGIPITGKPDVIYAEQELMVDYKTTAAAPRLGPYDHHLMQLNIYRWLVQVHYRVSNLEIVYLDMKGAKRYSIPTIPLKKVEEFILPRAHLLHAALDGGSLPPQAEGEGLWQCWGYCPFSHHPQCWDEKGPPERNRKETKSESKKRAIRRSYAKEGSTSRRRQN